MPTIRVEGIRRRCARVGCSLIAGAAISTLFDCCATNVPRAPLRASVTARPTHSRPISAPSAGLVTASWYGPGLAGHRAASGEIYNPDGLTAASKSLPLGSVVRVTNPDNGRSVNVRINDRGPYRRGRSLDLSHRAAQKLGIIHKGVARVMVTRLSHSDRVASGNAPAD
jgi:rare lipoprotein A (peptidoglycan hydrolase)